jgi:uracil-DNA glycosylase family 4
MEGEKMIVNTEGPTNAKIMLVGESPGEEEDNLGKPFVGYAGKTLDALLSQAGIARYQCLVTNVARERPPANKIHFFFEDKKCTIPKPKLQVWIEKLKEEIELYRPNVIIALGVTALWALTGEKRISEFRGYILPCTLVPGQKVLATYHPQAVNYDWKLYFQTVLDLRKGLRHSEFPEIKDGKQTLLPNVDLKTFINYMEECIAHPEWKDLSVDVETLQPGSHIEELGISHDPDFGMSILLLKGRAPALPERDELLLWQTFARLVACKQVVMQNGAYDIGVLWHNNHILVENLRMDTLIAAHVCWPELPRDLGFLGSICLDIAPWKSKSIRTSEYNPADAANTLGIALVLENEIKRQLSQDQFDFEMNLIPVSLMMQLQGIDVDTAVRDELIAQWTKKRQETKEKLDLLIGREINFNSPKQMQQLLYMELHLPVQYKRRKSVEEPRTMTTDANALRALARLVPNNPVFNLILEYKKADTLIERFLKVELSPEGKVHTSYNITGASSDDEEDTKKTKRSFGRWSSSASIILPFGSGNLQNIPYEARKMYRAKPGYKIVQADYSQAEAVVMAHLTGDQKLVKMFRDSFGLSRTEKKSYDVHKLTFAQMAGIDISQVTPEQRTAGKTVRHATNYSAGPQVLANRLGIKLGDAKQLIELYHRANPQLRIWYSQVQQELKRSRVLTNLLGRKHKFLDRWGDSLFRSAYSYIPQSTVGDLLNTALLRLYNKLPSLSFDITILLQLHDAIYTMVEEQYVMDTVKIMRECMLIPLYYANEEFMIDVDFKVGDSWAEGEELEINWRNG